MPAQVVALLLLAAACSAPCPPAAAGAASAASADKPIASSDLVARAEALADEVCACPSAMCADDAAARFAELLEGRGELDQGAAAQLLSTTKRLIDCRVALAYPPDPVDMDGAGEAPSSGGDSG